MWNQAQLTQLIQEKLGKTKFIMVANRQPYKHVWRDGKITYVKSTGGVVSALDPVMRVCKGTWVAYGDGDADRKMTGPDDKLMVPPDDPSYTLKRIWLNNTEADGYYYGFSNQVLWPLCHVVYQRPSFKPEYWNHYVTVNKRFADAVLDEIKGEDAFIFVQDYHLALFSKFVKEKRPDVRIAQFWHIPWPNPEVFWMCPQTKEILKGLLANDLFTLQVSQHVNHFLETADQLTGVRVEKERSCVVNGTHETLIQHTPISVDFKDISKEAATPEIESIITALKEKHQIKSTQFIFGGLERLDYTKGIPERLIGYKRFLEKYPHYRKKVIYFQAGEQSRTHIEKYRQLNKEIETMIDDINWKYAEGDWKPVILCRDRLSPEEILALFRMSHGFLVSSLHDGMNLVAKEFVASRCDEKGILILSKFTGSSRELTEAILVNPYDQEEMADSLNQAMQMPLQEQTRRMKQLRDTVSENNIYKWIGTILTQLTSL